MDKEIKQGSVFVCIIPGNYGNPCPAVVVQSDMHNKNCPSVLICPITTSLTDDPIIRMLLTPTELNGLSLESQIMIDKIHTIRRDKIQKKIGELSADQLEELIKAVQAWMN